MLPSDPIAFISNLFYYGEASDSSTKEGEQDTEITIPNYTVSRSARKVLLISIALWYLLWAFGHLIPDAMRPTIDVTTLADCDRYLFFSLPHQLMTGFQSIYLDVLMAIPYSLHLVWPITFIIYCLRYSRGLLFPFLNCFGVTSLLSVFTEMVFPTAPPWYLEKYGTAPASYSLLGDPGGLGRVDEHFGIQFYNDTFSQSPLVFGAFPSLHVGWPALLTLFMWFNVCRNHYQKIPVCLYLLWMCFAVVYLHHHYVVDVLGGILYSWITYYLLGPHWDLKKT